MNDLRTCTGCGHDHDAADFHEGYCLDCFAERQRELDEFNARYQWWRGLTPSEKEKQIQWAMF